MKVKLLKIITTWLILICGILLIQKISPTQIDVDQDALNVAYKLFEAGHYPEAAKIFTQLQDNGVEDSTLFYNLGNIYFKSGDLGKAIINFQRASQLAPRDKDIRDNLESAELKITSSKASHPKTSNPLTKIAQFTQGWLNLNETAILALSLWFGFTFMWITVGQIEPGKWRSMLRSFSIFLLVLVLGIVSSLTARMYNHHFQMEGIILDNNVSIYDSPEGQDTNSQSLQSGNSVFLDQIRGDWAHFTLPDESINGWIPVSTFELTTLDNS